MDSLLLAVLESAPFGKGDNGFAVFVRLSSWWGGIGIFNLPYLSLKSNCYETLSYIGGGR